MKDLIEYCQTDRQREIINAVIEHGSQRKAAAALGVNKGSVDKAVNRVKAAAAKKGYSPDHDMIHTVPDGYKVKGVSTMYKPDGSIAAQWVKSSLDEQVQAEIMRAAIEAMSEEIPRIKAQPAPAPGRANLLNCYVLTDFHLGLLSHREETGDDYDLKIAEKLLIDWFSAAIAQAPDADTGLFLQLSDLLHFDGMDAVTPASKHLLDVDTRFYKVVRCAIRCIRQIIGMLLAKHQKVHCIFADANHDPVSQIWIREMMTAMYENEPRITIDNTPSPYNAYEFGKVAIFSHHGHKRGVSNVSEVFAAQFRELFGRTKYAYAHLGHLHHVDVKENNLMIVEQHRTLAAKDAYAARGGWLAGRSASVITYHSEFGEVSRMTISPEMLA